MSENPKFIPLFGHHSKIGPIDSQISFHRLNAGLALCSDPILKTLSNMALSIS